MVSKWSGQPPEKSPHTTRETRRCASLAFTSSSQSRTSRLLVTAWKAPRLGPLHSWRSSSLVRSEFGWRATSTGTFASHGATTTSSRSHRAGRWSPSKASAKAGRAEQQYQGFDPPAPTLTYLLLLHTHKEHQEGNPSRPTHIERNHHDPNPPPP
ncbi:hypothetical protein FRIGORI9N_400129 [Frigoribacterium sp. 9N]|nr:hypothetical protein FRIGORI9N_400129 [Frigoribacterium sp. 9N]